MQPSTTAASGPTEWAGIWSDATRSRQERADALGLLIARYRIELETGAERECGGILWNSLHERIVRLARRVTRNYWGCDDFIDDAATDVLFRLTQGLPPICRYDSTVANLDTFLAAVLRNKWKDRLRAPQRKVGSLSLDWDSSAPIEECWFTYDEPFEQADIKAILRWSLADRVVLLCLSGLWVKVPNGTWEQWLARYEAERELPLGRPFPPIEWRGLDSGLARKGPLAAVLGMRLNALHVRWSRGFNNRVKALPCFQQRCLDDQSDEPPPPSPG